MEKWGVKRTLRNRSKTHSSESCTCCVWGVIASYQGYWSVSSSSFSENPAAVLMMSYDDIFFGTARLVSEGESACFTSQKMKRKTTLRICSFMNVARIFHSTSEAYVHKWCLCKGLHFSRLTASVLHLGRSLSHVVDMYGHCRRLEDEKARRAVPTQARSSWVVMQVFRWNAGHTAQDEATYWKE